MNNLIVSYELLVPSDNEGAVIGVIKRAGNAVRMRHALWYVRSPHSVAGLADQLRGVMEGGDNVVVIDASNDRAAWFNLNAKLAEALLREWRREAG